MRTIQTSTEVSVTGSGLRVALLTYRGNPFCGGQGIYVRHLSRELVRLGHHVDVLSGPPYPVLDAGRAPDRGAQPRPLPGARPVPHARAARSSATGSTSLEFGTMMTAGFPEPLTFSLRARRLLAAAGADYDVVHDNQSLGYGLLGLRRCRW